MRFTPEPIDELCAIYRNEFHEEITSDEAREMGSRLVELLRLLLRPLPRRVANGDDDGPVHH